MNKELFIIAGLGNPGKQYENTRHNLGFLTIDYIAEKNNINVTKNKFKALIGDGTIGGKRVLLVKPQTFMNLSGDSLRDIMNFYKVNPENLIVIYDDFDIELGTIRIRKFGSAGTHNGMRSIVSQLGTDRFPRIRVGINSKNKGDLINFVIGGFSKEEVPLLEDGVKQAALGAECYVKNGIDLAMNRYNSKKKKEKKTSKNGVGNNSEEKFEVK